MRTGFIIYSAIFFFVVGVVTRDALTFFFSLHLAPFAIPSFYFKSEKRKTRKAKPVKGDVFVKIAQKATPETVRQISSLSEAS